MAQNGLTQGEIFQNERLSMDEEAAQEASEQGHPGTLAGVGKSNDFRLDGFFAAYAWRYKLVPIVFCTGKGLFALRGRCLLGSEHLADTP